MILNGNVVAPVDPLTGYLETAVTAYDQQIVSQNSSGAILLFVGLLLLAGMEK